MKWGIVGLGKIANGFVKDLIQLEPMVLDAVASRSLDKADAFKSQYGANKAYGCYDDLFNDQEVDIVYIATPHNSHMSLSIAAMKAGKHVLCEKPIAINQAQMQMMIDQAKESKVFLMEALWTRFNPSILKIFELINSGANGQLNYINADFCFQRDFPVESRMLDISLAGGSLLDIGIYPVFLAYLLMGMPKEILASAHFHQTGADLQTTAILKYDSGFANIMSSVRSQSDMVAEIHGDKGSIIIDTVWHETEGFKLILGDEIKTFHYPKKGKGYTYEIQDCYDSLVAGKCESDHWSLQDSFNLVSILDSIREKIGLKYPFE